MATLTTSIRIRRSIVTGVAALGIAFGAAALDNAAQASMAHASYGAVHCHTVEGCTEGELHHGEHRLEDHARHERHRLEHGHVF